MTQHNNIPSHTDVEKNADQQHGGMKALLAFGAAAAIAMTTLTGCEKGNAKEIEAPRVPQQVAVNENHVSHGLVDEPAGDSSVMIMKVVDDVSNYIGHNILGMDSKKEAPQKK